jgi:hypothetical protein
LDQRTTWNILSLVRLVSSRLFDQITSHCWICLSHFLLELVDGPAPLVMLPSTVPLLLIRKSLRTSPSIRKHSKCRWSVLWSRSSLARCDCSDRIAFPLIAPPDQVALSERVIALISPLPCYLTTITTHPTRKLDYRRTSRLLLKQ